MCARIYSLLEYPFFSS
uniref:Uncharacterized protein n=1 Tax=Arundo donax TaxID=35708 RepID=A0A0A9F9R3_ARUDO